MGMVIFQRRRVIGQSVLLSRIFLQLTRHHRLRRAKSALAEEAAFPTPQKAHRFSYSH
jgi:hypothetical protein